MAGPSLISIIASWKSLHRLAQDPAEAAADEAGTDGTSGHHRQDRRRRQDGDSGQSQAGHAGRDADKLPRPAMGCPRAASVATITVTAIAQYALTLSVSPMIVGSIFLLRSVGGRWDCPHDS